MPNHYHLLLETKKEDISGGMHLLNGRYIALNPVRAGLCADPGEWPWSSYDRAW